MFKYPFAYTAIYLGEDKNYIRESGMGIAEDYSDAMGRVSEYYGTDLLCIKHLELFAENELILLPESIINMYRKTEYGVIGVACDADGNPIPTEANDVIEKGSNIYEC